MKHVDEYRDPQLATRMLDAIRRRVSRPWVIMEVCGGQTHGLVKSGILEELDGVLELVHGPGCPVCVTPAETIDLARQLSLLPDVILASFGDMLRVPGSHESLLAARAQGGQLRVVYSPLDAVELARTHPRQTVVFLAVGFETTAPATALAVLQASRLGLENFCLLMAHVRVQPAMEAILQQPDCRVQGFLAAGHVCTVLGCDSYHDLTNRYHVPVVVTGFEPVDLLRGLLECVEQLETGHATVSNAYRRSVQELGNPQAINMISQVYEVADRPWRGLPLIPGGGLVLRPEWRKFDAEFRFESTRLTSLPILTECRSGDVLSGRIKPTACEAFGTRCTPDNPLGAPMVSSEGACAAYHASRHRVHHV